MRKYIFYIVSLLGVFMAGRIVSDIKYGKKILSLVESCEKDRCIIETFSLWIQQKLNNHQIEGFLEQNGFYEVAIYGMHYLGECLLKDLQNTRIAVKYAIDIRADEIVSDIKVVLPSANLEKVDAIVVTPIYGFDEIAKQLSGKVNCPIISMNEAIGNA